jgi:hypothetical protein
MLKPLMSAIVVAVLVGPVPGAAQTPPPPAPARPAPTRSGGYDALLATQQSDITLLQRRNAELEADNRNVRATIDSLRGEVVRLRQELTTAVQAQSAEHAWSRVRLWLVTISAAVALAAAAAALLSFRHARRVARREAAERVFRDWWSDELSGLRGYFFNEFLPRHWPALEHCGVKDLAERVPEDGGRARRLCFFFDKVGWQAAMGLVRVEDVMPPMQQTMRRTWQVMQPLIEYDRAVNLGSMSDPVYLTGFEWLFEWSERPRNHHARILLSAHGLLRRRQVKALRQSLDRQNAAFLEYCAGLRRAPAAVRDAH